MSRIQNRIHVQLGKFKRSVLREWGGGWQREKRGEGGGIVEERLKGFGRFLCLYETFS